MNLRETFRAEYGADPVMVWAPGRVNLIGEHIDYCGGCVLPMPIQYGTHVAIRLASDSRVAALSCNQPERVTFAVDRPPDLPAGHWGRYVAGAIACMSPWLEGRGVDILVYGDIPGSGLSSSASLSVALLFAVAAVVNVRVAPLEIARLAQRIEHEFVGVGCGLMDQAVIAMGAVDAAFLFDCHAQHGYAVDFPEDAPEVLVVDSGKPRALVHSSYNDRLDETARAARAFGVERDVLACAKVDIATVRALDPVARRRFDHVRSEQARVDAAVTAVRAADWLSLGRLFRESHASLANDFEVSCTELDRLVDLLTARPECLGARMTGAGFGGSVVALVERGNAESVHATIESTYREATGLSASAFVARSIGGVRRVDG